MSDDSERRCGFRTARLEVGDWHEFADRFRFDLVEVVAHILTPATTSGLPPEWQGRFDDERAAAWIEDRDDESPTLLVVERVTSEPVGLLVLFAPDPDPHAGPVEVRVGYVIAQSAWGRGLASELVGGLVAWARSEPWIGSISAGVAEDNSVSQRVLLKNGFHPVAARDEQRTYRIDVWGSGRPGERPHQGGEAS